MTTAKDMDHGAQSDARTPGEARDMACPFMGGAPCKAQGCMAWRWIGYKYEIAKVPVGMKPEGEGWVHLGTVSDQASWRRPRAAEGRRGYCGAVVGTALITTSDT